MNRVSTHHGGSHPSPSPVTSDYRTPLAFVFIVYILLVVGLSIFIATGSPMIALITAVGSIGAGLVVWAVYHRLNVPRRVDVVKGAIALDTRGAGRMLLPAAEYLIRVNRAWRFGALLTYTSRTSGVRSRALFLTQNQTHYLLSHGPGLFALE